MSDDIVRYCSGHKNRHEDTEWRWHKVGRKWYCHSYFYCDGCEAMQATDGYMRITSDQKTGKLVRYCHNCTKPSAPTMAQKVANMSPEDVMSGVHLGSERLPYLGADSNDYSVERRNAIREVKKNLS